MEEYGMPLEVRTISPSWFCFDDSEFLIIEASNCGGVAVSGLEMAQNSQRLAWTSQEVDAKLKGIMAECYKVRSFFIPF
jgi:hypothetical protein